MPATGSRLTTGGIDFKTIPLPPPAKVMGVKRDRCHAECPECGGKMTSLRPSKRCRKCSTREQRERREKLIALWAAGANPGEIGAELGMDAKAVLRWATDLRRRGYDVPKRSKR